ncbi:uncharacterized, partial [Tachysurus ichikawai]
TRHVNVKPEATEAHISISSNTGLNERTEDDTDTVQLQQHEKPHSSDTDTLRNSEVKDVHLRAENKRKGSQQRVSKCCNAGD